MPRTTKQPQKAVYMPPELIARWKQSAEKNHRSMNAEIVVALEFYLDTQEKGRFDESDTRVQDRTGLE
jgi:hypothetical protein